MKISLHTAHLLSPSGNQRHLIIGLCILLGGNAQTQVKNEVDSLWKIWRDPQLTDTIRASALFDLANEVRLSDPDSAARSADALMDLANKNDLPRWQGKA